MTHKSGEPFTLTVSYPATKTDIASDGKVTWVEGEDNVVVHNGYTYETVPVANVSADGRSATITTTVDAAAGTFSVKPGENTYTFPVPGYLYYSSASYDKPAQRGKYWTCSNSTYGTSLYVYDSSGSAVISIGGQRKANGQSVRCVADD